MVVKVNVSTASFPDLFLQFMSTIEWGRSGNEAAVSTCTGFCNTLLQKYQSNQFEFLINLHVVDNKKD